MKIGYFQKAISSLSLAVLTGVILFSVGSGTSATPEYRPPGAGVYPTFSGVTVSGDMNIAGKIKDPNGDGTINLENHLDVLGTVSAGTVDADKIKNGTVGDGGWVTVDDKFAVTQNSNFKGNVIIENTLSVWDAVTSLNGLIKTNKVQSGVIDVTGTGIENSNAKSNGGAVKINDALNVTGTLSAASPSFTGTVSADNLDIKMGLQITQGLTFDYSGTKPTADSYESFIYHDSSGGNAKNDNLIIQSNDNIKLVTNPSWGAGPGTVQVQGKLIVTKGIGTITNFGIDPTACNKDASCDKITNGWAKFPIPKGKIWQNFSYTHACPTGYVAIACTYNDEHTDQDNVNVLNLYNSGSNCIINFDAKNDNAGGSPGIKIHASCWNQSI